jgi:hypothetical protein
MHVFQNEDLGEVKDTVGSLTHSFSHTPQRNLAKTSQIFSK